MYTIHTIHESGQYNAVCVRNVKIWYISVASRNHDLLNVSLHHYQGKRYIQAYTNLQDLEFMPKVTNSRWRRFCSADPLTYRLLHQTALLHFCQFALDPRVLPPISTLADTWNGIYKVLQQATPKLHLETRNAQDHLLE